MFYKKKFSLFLKRFTEGFFDAEFKYDDGFPTLKKRSFVEPFWGFCYRVKDRILKKVVTESGFREKLMKPFIIPY